MGGVPAAPVIFGRNGVPSALGPRGPPWAQRHAAWQASGAGAPHSPRRPAADRWAEKPAFGTPLEEHLKRSGREIALPLEACVMLLLETGMREEVRPRRLPLPRSPRGVPATPAGAPLGRRLPGAC